MADATSAAESFGGELAALAMDAHLLRVHGEALKKLGKLAPKCLVRPYRKYRQAVGEMAASIYQEIADTKGEETLAQFRSRTLQLEYEFSKMPEVSEEWTDGPAQWDSDHAGWPPGTFASAEPGGTSEPLPPTPLGKLGRLGDEVPLIDFAPGSFAPPGTVVTATEAVAKETFWRGILSGAGRAAGSTFRFLKTRNFWMLVAFTVGPTVIEAGYRWVFGEEPRGDIKGHFKNLQQSFEWDYIPKTAQQWQAVIKAVRASGGDPVLLERLLRASNPWVEPVVPPAPDDYDWVNLGHLSGTSRPHVSPWASLLTLAAGLGMGLGVAETGEYE
jgi:hypothetical protein